MADASVTIDEIAKLCGVKPRTVSQWVDRGELAAVRLDRHHVRIRSSDLEAIVVARAAARHAEAQNVGNRVPDAEPVYPADPARIEGTDSDEARLPVTDSDQTPPWIAIADTPQSAPSVAIPKSEESRPSVALPDSEPTRVSTALADSEEAPLWIADSDANLPPIDDDDEVGLLGRIFVRSDGGWRWTMYAVWPLLWLVAVLASVELAPLLR